MDIGDVLYQERSSQDMTRARLSKLSGVSERHIQFIEKKKTVASKKVIYKLSRALGTDLDKLLETLNQEQEKSVLNKRLSTYASEQARYQLEKHGIVDIGEGVRVPVQEAQTHSALYSEIPVTLNSPTIRALKITGESLTHYGVHAGDILFIDISRQPVEGNYILCYNTSDKQPQIIKYSSKRNMEDYDMYGIIISSSKVWS